MGENERATRDDIQRLDTKPPRTVMASLARSEAPGSARSGSVTRDGTKNSGRCVARNWEPGVRNTWREGKAAYIGRRRSIADKEEGNRCAILSLVKIALWYPSTLASEGMR